jgi:serine/threonine protein kinase
MEFVRGVTLDTVIEEGPSSPRQIAQIAWDLLDVIHTLQSHNCYHNDLHGKNIIVTDLKSSDSRLRAIDPTTGLKVLDLGSASDNTKSTTTRLGDIHWVAYHILGLLQAYERKAADRDPSLLRTCAQLRRVAEHYFGKDKSRSPTPQDMQESIRNAYTYALRPAEQPLTLPSISTHYNAKTLPAFLAPGLLYDPTGYWAKRLTGPGPQLLFGMRGCGKTMLLRSLQWAARVQPRMIAGAKTENADDVQKRVGQEGFLGLFVSCSALLGGPNPELVDRPILRTFLAFATEIIRNIEECALRGIGSVDYSQLHQFSDFIHRIIWWYTPPSDPSDVWVLSKALSTALTSPSGKPDRAEELAPLVMFQNLVQCSRQLVDIWAGKVFLFMLDDVSTRVLLPEDVRELLSQLCIQDSTFGFKISTEQQTLELRTEGGLAARMGRDYVLFDLGSEVLSHLGGKAGTKFISKILQQRAQIADNVPRNPVKDILGQQTLEALAKTIRDSSASQPVYWGVDALAGLCVGDVGDVLQLYENILARSQEMSFPVKPMVQHKAAIELAETKLRSLVLRKEWLYSHAMAFAQAAHRELLRNSDRIRQFSRVHINITPEDAEALFPKVLELVDAGVFVFIGGQERSKGARTDLRLQFKLAYRKLLGLPARIPLSDRDRFEPASSDELRDWLQSPTGDKLRWGQLPQDELRKEDTDVNADESGVIGGNGDQPVQQSIRDIAPHSVVLPSIELPGPRGLFDVATTFDGPVEAVGERLDWGNVTVLGAFGFEDRSIGAWRNLLATRTPPRAVMLGYEDRGIEDDIVSLLNNAGVRHSKIFRPQFDTAEALVEEALKDVPQGDHLIVDTAALTKEIIYEYVCKILRAREEVWVLHTTAETYFPSATSLEEAVAGVETDLLAIKRLDEIMEGEQGPYRTRPVGRLRRDPGVPSLLAAFVPLKHARIAEVLRNVAIDSIAAIVSVHSNGESDPRTKAGQYLADHLVQQYGGSKLLVRALDHQGTYETLRDLHRKHSLGLGYNFEVALTGGKMQAVGAGMLGATTTPAAVYYSAPSRFVKNRFTEGTGATRIVCLRRKMVPEG